MNILLVSSYLPFPLFSGGHIRLYNLLKELGKKHAITLVCESRSYQTEHDIREVEKICKRVITVPRKKQWSAKNIVDSGFSRDPFLVTGHTNPQLQEEITKILANEVFDLIHVETFYVIQNIPMESKVPIVLVEHNIEYLVYQRYAKNAPFFLRPLLGVDVFKLKQMEEKAWERATRLVAVSEDEKNVMKKHAVSVVPNGVDIERFSFKEMKKKEYHSVAKKLTLPEKELLFIGDFKWIQNRDTVKWIIQDIWPFLLRAIDGDIKIKLWVVGKNIPPYLKALNKYDGIVFDENAPNDTTDIFKRADILLAPIRVGGGTSYKILEAMASGVPVVTTELGFEGLHAKKDEAILVGDDVQTIVEKTARLLRDEELFFSVAKNARKAIEDYYDWKRIAKKLEDVYLSIKK